MIIHRINFLKRWYRNDQSKYFICPFRSWLFFDVECIGESCYANRYYKSEDLIDCSLCRVKL